jgi:hypothetical protein
MGRKLRARIPLSNGERQQTRKQTKELATEYFKKWEHEFVRRMIYCTLLTIDDIFCDRFGDTEEEIEKNYQRLALCLGENFHGYARDFKSGDLDEYEHISDAMEAELKSRNIEIVFK